jgi:hypothetical protein
MLRTSGAALTSLIVLLLLSPQLAQAGSCTLGDLGWLAGAWRNEANPAGAQER